MQFKDLSPFPLHSCQEKEIHAGFLESAQSKIKERIERQNQSEFTITRKFSLDKKRFVTFR